MASLRGLVRRIRRVIGFQERVPELDARLMSMERLFRAPPFTPELVAAIKLISPHCDFTTNDKYRAVWEADQNGACWGEYEALSSILTTIPRPKKILEIGPGMGRSLVFFSKKLGWKDSEIHAFEGNGNTTKYTIQGPRFEDSYCGNIGMLQEVLSFNDVNNVKVFDAKETRLADLPGPYDLIYSFYCIGFHWSLEHFLDDLLPQMHDESLAIFTVPRDFLPFPRLATLPHRLIDWKTAWPKEDWLKMIILGKVPIAASG